MAMKRDAFKTWRTLETQSGAVTYASLPALADDGRLAQIDRLPFSIRVLLENVLRNIDDHLVKEEDVRRLARWNAQAPELVELPFIPARVLLQDFTGVPAIVDLASMRAAVARLKGDPTQINPLVPVDLVIDHSVQVDFAGASDALARNTRLEFERNSERYQFLRWGQNAFRNFRVIPPSMGIVHQVNLERLAKGVFTREEQGRLWALPDTLVGTDSHTTMINGLGVLGWGVGGIEAEAAMLGQPLYMVTPQVVGMRLTGRLMPGVTATDLVLTLTEILRKRGVVEKFVEFFGPGVEAMRLTDRATVANMAPEYGATMGFFPIDQETLDYLRRTGRTDAEVDLVERYTKTQGLFRASGAPDPVYSDVLELDLAMVEACLAGPKRPHDRVTLVDMQAAFRKALTAPVQERGFGLQDQDRDASESVAIDGQPVVLRHGSVVIAAITSCTNTSNPTVLLAAGLLARKARARGLSVPAQVKTSLAPGSRVVTQYLTAAGLLADLEALGFHVVGYGCTTCIGNSGPIDDTLHDAIVRGKLVVSAVLSGNRNFEGRIHADVKANYLASPPLVVAYALAGTTDIDLARDPLGRGRSGAPVYLRDIWPSEAEIEGVLGVVERELFTSVYQDVFKGSPEWNAVPTTTGNLYEFDTHSTYIQEPPFFQNLTRTPAPPQAIRAARILAILGDSVTTDHISPAGSIAENSAAGLYLKSLGVAKADFNSYGARRGNDRIMVRGTFANIRLKNAMVPGVEGGVTIHHPSGEQMSIFDAAERYRQEGRALVVIAGREYGSGSSRDWAAKGPLLLGVRAVVACSYERIHRSNLIGMGILPLEFKDGESAATAGLTGHETLTLTGLNQDLLPRQDVRITVERPDGSQSVLVVRARLDTAVEIDYFRNGGILQTVLRGLLACQRHD
jgi:aconitate hydratase